MKGKPRAREARGDPPRAPRAHPRPRPGRGGRLSCRRGCGGDVSPGASSGLSRPL